MASSGVQAPTGPPRQEMVSSAVSFLQDPKVASSSMAQRIAFLESKGLTSVEIDEALGRSRLVGAAQPPQPPAKYTYAQQPYEARGLYYLPQGQQEVPSRDWRDWFIMVVISGTVGCGIVALARRYLFPHLQPPNQTILESDRDALTAKYDEVAAMLAELDAETRAVKEGLERQKFVIEAELKQVEDAMQQLRSGEKVRKEEMERVAREVDSMKRDMPRMFESASASTATSLKELQNELKSLRSLLVSRTSINNGGGGSAGATLTSTGAVGGNHVPNGSRPGTGVSSPCTGNSSPAPPPFGVGQSGFKPSIPAWQLAASDSEAGSKDKADELQDTSAVQVGKDHDNKEGGYEV